MRMSSLEAGSTDEGDGFYGVTRESSYRLGQPLGHPRIALSESES
jgi:hypothetical protein